jgi:lysophospholipase L1-like esterase
LAEGWTETPLRRPAAGNQFAEGAYLVRRVRTFRRLLLFSYPLLLLAIGLLLWRGNFFGSRNESTSAPDDYKSNPHWMEQSEFYGLYRDTPRIVLIGTSLTARILWGEALGRPEAAGRGVNGDVTAGILARVAAVTARPPAICFVEGGINDLDRGLALSEIAGNLTEAAQRLEAAGVRPVLTAIFPVTDAYPDFGRMNARIDSVNRRLRAAAGDRHWDFLDINASLAPGGTRLRQYARGDGLHLTAAAYRLWIGAVDSLLRQRGL